MRDMTDALWAFHAYEAVRHRLPHATFPALPAEVGGLADLANRADGFLLDAFGVLNVGETAIPGAIAAVDALRSAGKRVMVVSNAAGYCKRRLLERYGRLGFSFGEEDVVTSRDAALHALAVQPALRWGVMAAEAYGREGLEHLDFQFLDDTPAGYAAAESFLMLGSGEWSEARQDMLESALRDRPRPVFVGNPDIVAPREAGLSKEPGHYAHRLADALGVVPEFFGKPFANVFDLALSRMDDIDPVRIMMVGDTLQTDILGGRAAGVQTALVTAYGALVGVDAEWAMRTSGIVPDYILDTV